MARNAFQLVKGVHVPGTKWLLVREIARGGMGVTWEVVKHPGIRGVMKMILPDLSTSASYVRRFLEEVEILTKLNHPNIVQVFDFDTLDDGTPFFVMERLEGKSLGAAMVTTKGGARVRKAFPARVAYEITRQTCEALYRAHSLQPKGVIHRDLKPENVYIHHPPFGGEPIIKLLDFGVAAFEQATRESGPVGTPRYMAPEQLRCEDITPKADLYAMGLVLYEMLVGRGPFDHLTSTVHPNDRALILVNAHLNETPPPPSEFAPWIPQTIDSLLLSALDKDPEKRPVSAYAFVAKLYELQFVNDGTPREAIDANTTAPTLVKIIEDDAPESDPVVSPPARSSLPNDTVRDAPRDFSGHTVEMPIDPFGNTTPKVQPVSAQDGVDRNAPTRLSADLPPRRRVASYDTEPMLSRELERPRAQPAPSLAPTNPEATPLTSEMPARSSARLAAGRGAKGERSNQRKVGPFSGLRLLGLFLVLCPVGAGLGLALKHIRSPATATAPVPPTDLRPSPSTDAPEVSAPPWALPPVPPSVVASAPRATAPESQPPPMSLAPAASALPAIASAPAAVPPGVGAVSTEAATGKIGEPEACHVEARARGHERRRPRSPLRPAYEAAVTRGPNDTSPMGLPVDPDRTDPGEAPALSATTDPTTDPGWPPGVTPITLPVKPADNGTDPGLDPMLKAFNRPPRPPAPQPNLRPSSDGDEFAAHYASPRELRSPHVRPTAHDPAVLVQLAQLARSDTSPMADPTPDAALAVQRDVQTAIVVGRKRRVPLRIMLIALAGGGLIAASGAVAFLGSAKSPTTGTDSANVQPLPLAPSAVSSSPSSPSVAPALPTPPPVTATATASTVAPPPPVVVRPPAPAATPIAPPPIAHPTSPSSPRPATSEHVRPAVPPRPAHENPDTVL